MAKCRIIFFTTKNTQHTLGFCVVSTYIQYVDDDVFDGWLKYVYGGCWDVLMLADKTRAGVLILKCLLTSWARGQFLLCIIIILL